MLLDDFIKEFSKIEGKINKGSILGSIPHGGYTSKEVVSVSV